MVDGKEVVVTDMDESLKIQNEARNMLKNANGDGVVSNVTEISNVTNVIVPPQMPVKITFLEQDKEEEILEMLTRNILLK